MSMENSETLGEVKKLIAELRAEKQQARKTALTFSVCIVVVFAAFAFVILNKIESNFAPETIQAALSQRIERLEPFVQMNIENIMDGVPDAYRAAFIAEMQKTLPSLKRNTMNETKRLVDGMVARLDSQLDQVIDSGLLESNEAFVKQYKASGQQMGRDWEKTRQGLAEKLDTITADASNRLRRNFQGDVQQLLATAQEFPRQSAVAANEAAATKMFISYWLHMIDDQLFAE